MKAIPVSWPPFNKTAKEIQTHLLTDVYMEALRKLAPDTGSYLNEVSRLNQGNLRMYQLTSFQGDVNEPNFQKAFWGSNYDRLLSIKRRVDPSDVFWCAACVGNENWHEQGNALCRY